MNKETQTPLLDGLTRFFKRKPKKHKITIVYKSGFKMYVRAEKFEVKWSDGELTSVAAREIKPRNIHIGINEIESIWIGWI